MTQFVSITDESDCKTE